MFSNVHTMSNQECSADLDVKSNRFKDVETEVLIDLYKDIEHSYRDINHVLENASAAQTLYFSADARSCEDTLTEIKCVLITRGIKEFASIEG
jgi:hypothetical protein